MLKIRDVREEDRVELFGMQKDFYSGEACEHSIPEENFEATLRECIRSREYGRLLIIEDEQGIAGYFLLAITWSNEAGGQVVWLEEAYFKEEARGKGYGSQVFGWVEKEYPRPEDSAWKPQPKIKRQLLCTKGLDTENCLMFKWLKMLSDLPTASVLRQVLRIR